MQMGIKAAMRPPSALVRLQYCLQMRQLHTQTTPSVLSLPGSHKGQMVLFCTAHLKLSLCWQHVCSVL